MNRQDEIIAGSDEARRYRHFIDYILLRKYRLTRSDPAYDRKSYGII